MTEEEYQAKLAEIQERNEDKEYRRKLREEKRKGRQFKLPETNKLMAIYLFALFNIIIVYTLVAMWHSYDFSYLGMLITDIGAQVLTYAIYCLKAYHGKKQEEQMKFERECMGVQDDEEPLG